MPLQKVNLDTAFSSIAQFWSPKIGGDINDAQLKLAKFSGSFLWHHHDNEDELFLVIKGRLRMKLKPEDGGDIDLEEGEYLIVPKGTEHCPSALTEEVHCILLEPNTTRNTGNLVNHLTQENLDRI